MRKHITLDSIDCKHLKYDAKDGFMCVNKDNTVCVKTFADATDCISCMRCKFDRLLRIEKEVRRIYAKEKDAKILRLA